MQSLFTLEYQIFALIAVGFLIARIGVIGQVGQKNLTDLVLYVVLPCNIFMAFLKENAMENGLDMILVLVISAGIQALSLLYAKFAFPKEHPDRRCNLAYAMICSNAGFLGNPVAEGVFGAAGQMLASLYLIPQRIMMWSEGLAIYAGATNRLATVKKVLTHPCVVACNLGVIVMLSGLRPPEWLLAPVNSLAKCNTPLSMLVIGMILSEIDPRTLVDKTVVRFTIHRLVLMPLIVYAACKALGLSGLVTGVSTLLAAMPAGATTSMMAAKYGRDEQFATKLVIFTTLMSIPAIFLWSLLLTM